MILPGLQGQNLTFRSINKFILKHPLRSVSAPDNVVTRIHAGSVSWSRPESTHSSVDCSVWPASASSCPYLPPTAKHSSSSAQLRPANFRPRPPAILSGASDQQTLQFQRKFDQQRFTDKRRKTNKRRERSQSR